MAVAGGQSGRARTVVGGYQFEVMFVRAWSPDGQFIAAELRRRDGPREIALISVRTGTIRTLKVLSNARALAMHFSPDGRYLVFDQSGHRTDEQDIHAITLADGGERPVISFPGRDALAGFSPDGTRLVFLSMRAGQVRPAPRNYLAPTPPGHAADRRSNVCRQRGRAG